MAESEPEHVKPLGFTSAVTDDVGLDACNCTCVLGIGSGKGGNCLCGDIYGHGHC